MNFSKIICAVDNDLFADSVLDTAVDLSQKLNAKMAILHVINSELLLVGDPRINANTIRMEVECNSRNFVERLQKKAHSNKVETFTKEGDPKRLIPEIAADWKADLIVMASHGRSGVQRVLLGSVAESVLRHSRVPVLILPKGH